MQTYRELQLEGRKILEEAGIADHTADAWLLMEYVTGMTRASYFLRAGFRSRDLAMAIRCC